MFLFLPNRNNKLVWYSSSSLELEMNDKGEITKCDCKNVLSIKGLINEDILLFKNEK